MFKKQESCPARLAKDTNSKLTLSRGILVSGICVVGIVFTVAFLIGPMNPIEHVATLI